MSFLSGIGNIVSKVLPKITSTISNIASTPAGKVGIDILKQLAQSAFSKDGKGGLFSDSFQLTLPNPLSRLNGLLGNIGSKATSIGDFLSNIGDFLQGKRQLENGGTVNLPRLGDRANTIASTASATAAAIANGGIVPPSTHDAGAATGSSSAASTSSTSSASTSATSGVTSSALDRISPDAFSTKLSPAQQNIINKAKAAGADGAQVAQMQAQMEMQNLQNLMQFMSNIMRIMGDISKGIVQNIR